MKKNTILYIIASIAVIILVLVLTKVFPPASDEDLSGTIGKVDRYRKVQMTERDVILRSEFVSDTSLLANSIKGLNFFNNVIRQYCSDLQIFADYLNKNEPSVKSTKSLSEFTKFVNENVASVDKTIYLLKDFYNGDTSDYSIDIEKKLKEFNNFCYQLMQKDTVLSKTLDDLENNISKSIVNSNDKKEGLRKLKNVHDQLLVRKLQINSLVGLKEQALLCTGRPFYEASNIGVMVAGQASINGMVYNTQQNKAIHQLVQLGVLPQKVLSFVDGVENKSGSKALASFEPVQNSKVNKLDVFVLSKALNTIIPSHTIGTQSNQQYGVTSSVGMRGDHIGNVHNRPQDIVGAILVGNQVVTMSQALPGYFTGSKAIDNKLINNSVLLQQHQLGTL